MGEVPDVVAREQGREPGVVRSEIGDVLGAVGRGQGGRAEHRAERDDADARREDVDPFALAEEVAGQVETGLDAVGQVFR
ncbi:hypothetical protein ACIGPN_06955 [Streptomyces afghaniensis]|uniref:hypothetical protein n=1 Tax=Streptomyces afghaniensis TaxID=66865 RepID=UPI0037D6009F